MLLNLQALYLYTPTINSFDLTGIDECRKVTSEIYNIRGSLVHDGIVKPKKKSDVSETFYKCFQKLEMITQNILYNEFTQNYYHQ